VSWVVKYPFHVTRSTFHEVRMLTTLRIKNFALLKDITIEFEKGLNVLTGETGAGKSIIIGALNIAAGERGYTENIRTGEERAFIEAAFHAGEKRLQSELNRVFEEAGLERPGADIVIKREINRSSKGRIFINNSPATLGFLQKAGRLLIDIHGQHEHQSLLKEEVHIGLLDEYAGSTAMKNDVEALYGSLIGIDAEIKKLLSLEKEKQEKLDMINYRLGEIEQASLDDDSELEKLNKERMLMVNAEEVGQSVKEIIMLISPSSLDAEGAGAVDMLEKVKKNMEKISKVDRKAVSEYLPSLEDSILKTEEIKDFFAAYMDKVEFDPARLKETEERIETIEDMIKKYAKKSIKEIKAYGKELLSEKKSIELNSDKIKEKEKKKAGIAAELSKKAGALSEIRHKKAYELGKRIEEELKGLGISRGVFKAAVAEEEASDGEQHVLIKGRKLRVKPDGINSVEFLISLNPGEEVKPLVKVASGGEVSRIMLAIKNILSEADLIPVMVFDEIDTGISGKIAKAVGIKLNSISSKKQLICITHLPQIAAYSSLHYSVGKKIKDNKTETIIIRLGKKEKKEEIAKLLSGEKVTDASLKAAEELIKETETRN